MGHKFKSTMWRRAKLSIVGKALLQALQANNFTLFGTCSFQRPLQNFFYGFVLELLTLLAIAELANS